MSEDLRDWLYSTLKSQDIGILGEIEEVRVMPWSAVWRVQTNRGYFYIKQTFTENSPEISLIHYLQDQSWTCVPSIVSHHFSKQAFLMHDAGVTLRSYLYARGYDVSIIKEVFTSYIRMQRSFDHARSPLLKRGVKDGRLALFPDHYAAFLEQKAFLNDIHVSPHDQEILVSIQSKIKRLCDVLMTYAIRETLEHGDFQDNNVLIRDGICVINDWGDANIAHPFFSLASFLQSAERNHPKHFTQDVRNELTWFFIHHWLDQEHEKRLLEIFDGIALLNRIKWVMSFCSVTLECGAQAYLPFKDSIRKTLQEFLSCASRM